jgi:hypothetical protein
MLKARYAALVATLATLPGVVMAQASTVPDSTTQIGAITTSLGGYAAVMFALALAAVGILVGVKWIKRARGAA